MIKHKAMEWVAALRSGEYVQGTNYLQRITGEACCLGVACLMSGESKVPEKVKLNGRYLFGSPGSSSNLPASVHNLWGFHHDDGSRRDGTPLVFTNPSRLYGSLAQANDHGVTFAEIADYIEVHWEQL